MLCGSSKGSVDIIAQLKAISRCKSKNKILSSSSAATNRHSSSNVVQGNNSGTFGEIPVAVSVGVNSLSDDFTDEDYLYVTDEVTLAGDKNLIQKVRLAKCEYDIAWTLDGEINRCMRCTSHFSALFQRKHHCRICGYLVCTNCSPARLPLKGLYEKGGSRVCTLCYDNQASLNQLNANTVAFVSTAARVNTSIDGIVGPHMKEALSVHSVLKPKYDCSPYPYDENDYDLCVSSKHALQKERYSEYNKNGDFTGIPYKRTISFSSNTFASSYSESTTNSVIDQMAKLNSQLLDKKHQLDYEKGVLSKYLITPSQRDPGAFGSSSAVRPSTGVWESSIDSPLEFKENVNTSNNVYFKTPTIKVRIDHKPHPMHMVSSARVRLSTSPPPL